MQQTRLVGALLSQSDVTRLGYEAGQVTISIVTTMLARPTSSISLMEPIMFEHISPSRSGKLIKVAIKRSTKRLVSDAYNRGNSGAPDPSLLFNRSRGKRRHICSIHVLFTFSLWWDLSCSDLSCGRVGDKLSNLSDCNGLTLVSVL